MTDLERELAEVLNRHSAENGSDTPDFILAQYLMGCLGAWNEAVTRRETWYGRDVKVMRSWHDGPVERRAGREVDGKVQEEAGRD